MCRKNIYILNLSEVVLTLSNIFYIHGDVVQWEKNFIKNLKAHLSIHIHVFLQVGVSHKQIKGRSFNRV